MPDEPTDRDLLLRWAAGEQAAGAQLFDRYVPRVSRFFRNKIPDEAAQDDLVQATFEACFKSAKNYRGEAPFRSFLFGIAYNVLRRHFETRHASKLDFTEVSMTDLEPGPATLVGVKEKQQRIIGALRGLPLASQVVLELFYWESLSAGAIASSLDLPEGTVRTRLRRARVLMREALAAGVGTESTDSVEDLLRSIA